MKAFPLIFMVTILSQGSHSSHDSDKSGESWSLKLEDGPSFKLTISECCNTIRLEYEDFNILVYQKYPDFEKEPDTLNGKAHYTSKDFRYAIPHNTCQQLVITILALHGRYH